MVIANNCYHELGFYISGMCLFDIQEFNIDEKQPYLENHKHIRGCGTCKTIYNKFKQSLTGDEKFYDDLSDNEECLDDVLGIVD